MNSRVTLALLALVALVGYANAQAFCHTCEVMINDVKANHPEGFDNVTDQQLSDEMAVECDNQAAAFADACKSVVQQNEQELMAALRAGKSAHEVCVQGGLC